MDAWDIKDLLCRGYRYAFALTHDESAADDVLQDAWVSVLCSVSPRTPGVLFRAIRSRFIDRYRRSRLAFMAPVDDADAIVDSDECDVIAADTLERVLPDLRPAEREALYLHAVEGYTHSEIAELTESTTGAVRVMVCRARKKLREAIEQAEERCVG